MKRLWESGLCARLCGRLFATYLAVGFLALALLSAAFLFLIQREATVGRQRVANDLAQLASQVERSPWLSEGPERAYLVRSDLGLAVLMSTDLLNAFRSGEEPPEMVVIGESHRRNILERPTVSPMEPTPVPDIVTREMSLTLGALSAQQVSQLVSQAQRVMLCPSATHGTGSHCIAILPLELRPPVTRLMVALLPPRPLDEVYSATLRWLWPLAGLLLLVAAGLAWVMARVLTAPLGDIRRVAERVALGDLSLRVGGAPPGEMGRVVAVLNQALDQMAAAKAEQEVADRKRRELVASVSHEFRAPLASLRGYLELLQDGVIPPQNQARYIAVMLADTFRLNRLLDDLVEWTRIQTQQVALRPMPTDPLDACHRVAEQLHWQANAIGVELVLDLPPEAPLLMADPDRLDQVLVNLLENALRYAGRGGWVRITAAPTPDGRAFQIAVLDSGPGIPPEEQGRIWERFYKVDKARTPGDGGSGLGLAIVKQMVELMGGQVGLRSQAGQGSTFWFTLPVAEPSSPAGAPMIE